MNGLFSRKIEHLYKNCSFWTRLYTKIRLMLTPFEKVAEYVPKKGVIYDLGCGYGIFANLMAFHSPKRKIIGVDLSKDRIKTAEKTVGRRKNIRFINNDLKNINLEKCGYIVIYDVLHHMNYQAQEKLLKECFGKLDDKGLLIIKDNDTTPTWKFIWNYLHEIIATLLLITKSDKLSFRTKEEFLKLLFKTGFVVETVNIPTNLPYPFILYLCHKVQRKIRGKGIVFVNPPLSMEERYGSIAKGGRNAPPLGLCSLASVARENGYKVHIIDASVLNYSFNKIVKEIEEISPKYVGITATTLAIDRAGKLAEEIKKSNQEIIILIGGPHVTSLPKKTLSKYPAFDLGIIGEGEKTMAELLKAFQKRNKNLKQIPGLVFRQGRKLIFTARRPYIKNLDALPIPAWDLLPSLPKFYCSSPQSYNRRPSSSLVTSRGCPNQCTFCDRSVFGNYIRGYSAEYVLKMLKILTCQYGIKHILFDDDTFTILKPRLIKICQLIIKEKLDLTWTCLARVDTVDEKILKLMKKAGCWQILFGIESGNQEILDKLKKGIKLKQARKALQMTRRAGIRSKGFFILGTPFETKKTAERTIAFMKKVDLDDFHMTYFTPFPGTEIFNRQVKNKKAYERKWGQMNEWTPIFVPAGMTSAELQLLSKKAFRSFYLRPKIIKTYLQTAISTKNFSPLFSGVHALLKYLFLVERKTNLFIF